ncbi:MAG: hypothetical protein GY705_22295, partial [Bacteroidetes bacterium]|nr:hypothetical protein [Bacteroidota bacterium]
SALTTITTTQYDDLTASSEQKYYYRVKGNNAEGSSNFSPSSIGSRSSSAPLCSGAAHIFILLM